MINLRHTLVASGNKEEKERTVLFESMENELNEYKIEAMSSLFEATLKEGDMNDEIMTLARDGFLIQNGVNPLSLVEGNEGFFSSIKKKFKSIFVFNEWLEEEIEELEKKLEDGEFSAKEIELSDKTKKLLFPGESKDLLSALNDTNAFFDKTVGSLDLIKIIRGIVEDEIAAMTRFSKLSFSERLDRGTSGYQGETTKEARANIKKIQKHFDLTFDYRRRGEGLYEIEFFSSRFYLGNTYIYMSLIDHDVNEVSVINAKMHTKHGRDLIKNVDKVVRGVSRKEAEDLLKVLRLLSKNLTVLKKHDKQSEELDKLFDEFTEIAEKVRDKMGEKGDVPFLIRGAKSDFRTAMNSFVSIAPMFVHEIAPSIKAVIEYIEKSME